MIVLFILKILLFSGMLKILLELLVRLLKISIMIICLEEPLVVMLFIRVLDMDGALLNISLLD